MPLPLFISGGVALGGWRDLTPVRVEVVRADGTDAWLAAPYAKVTRGAAEGTLTTPGGSRLRFVDAYRSAKDGFTVERTVRVLAVGRDEAAFSTRFLLAGPGQLREREMFLPGVAYRRNEAVPAGALAGDLDDAAVLVREDRLPLPLAMLRDPRGGATVAMVHLRPDGASFVGEKEPGRMVDARMRFGSVGFLQTPPLSLAREPLSIPQPLPLAGAKGRGAGEVALSFQYPGSEGERTYVAKREKRWAYRAHPLTVGFEQRYALRFAFGKSKTFPDAVQTTWRRAFDEADPQPPEVDVEKIYRAEMDLLAKASVPVEGVPTVPFQLRLPDGSVKDSSSQMGFVGKALPVAALMLLEPALKEQAERIIDFWVANSGNPSGVPKTWYDIHAGGRVTWRDYPTHLRVASDGMLGVLDAHRLDPHPAWLAYARSYGDFLVAHQAADGSLAGAWRWDGTVDKPYLNATGHTIPFLVALFHATDDARYRTAALKAGGFCLRRVDGEYAYVGGTPDNPNVTDKEAGVLAMQAFLALHDLTKDPRWVAPAARAGTFAETWTYAWNVPIPPEADPDLVWPRSRSTLGLSLIATGHSGADDFMADAVYDYVRLAKLTKDPHFLRFAHFLQRGTAQAMDWDGTLGYALPGLLPEAMTFATNRGHGVKGWLPWLGVAVLEPLARLKDAYGTMDVDRLGLPPPKAVARPQSEP